tara:strand:- start:1577 stop:1882 length:306 start_codon:yes stop_codon:yes gene_type:complete
MRLYCAWASQGVKVQRYEYFSVDESDLGMVSKTDSRRRDVLQMEGRADVKMDVSIHYLLPTDVYPAAGIPTSSSITPVSNTPKSPEEKRAPVKEMDGGCWR